MATKTRDRARTRVHVELSEDDLEYLDGINRALQARELEQAVLFDEEAIDTELRAIVTNSKPTKRKED